ncbi:MAG TPA: hypothetical protein VFK54_13415 [Candidatus Limnocylindrales bacterium]|nr:hypothetical protein [Candidatus Limnocylindrales bacterium]
MPVQIRRFALAAGTAAAISVLAAAPAAAHIHPFNPAASCAPEETGAGNEAESFFNAPGIAEHWDIVDLVPGAPGTQFLIQWSNPGKAQDSKGAVGGLGLITGNPGLDKATANCATPKS